MNERIMKEQVHYKELGDTIFEILSELDRVCKKNGIQYYLAYGTLIGAVREHDLIEWDEDADVFIRTQDLQKLIEHKDDFRKEFRLIFPEDYGHNKYYDSVIRLVYLNSRVRADDEENQYYGGLRSYASIDLFHISPVPDNIVGRLYCIYMCVLYAMENAFRYQNKGERYTLWMKAASFVLTPLGKLIGLPRLQKTIQRGLSRFDSCKCSKIHDNNDTVKAMFIFHESSDFEKTSYLQIRDRFFPVPSGYDRVLRRIYGDYMILPPVEERKWKSIDPDVFSIN